MECGRSRPAPIKGFTHSTGPRLHKSDNRGPPSAVALAWRGCCKCQKVERKSVVGRYGEEVEELLVWATFKCCAFIANAYQEWYHEHSWCAGLVEKDTKLHRLQLCCTESA